MDFELSVGFYPGILFGFRTYIEEHYTAHVLYVPFIDIVVAVGNLNED